MLKQTTKQPRVLHVTRTVVTLLLLLGWGASTSAQERQGAVSASTSEHVSKRLTDLENAFWVCDYLATTQGVSDVETCAAIYTALKQHKFSGDSDKLVVWWQQNKVEQHQKVASLGRMVGSQ